MGSSDNADIHELPPELAALTHDAIARLARRFRALELPGNLTQERLSTLTTIRANEPISLSKLAEIEMVRLATMSRMVSSLEEVEIVRRRGDREDGRGIRISTTAKGRRLYERAVQQSLSQIIATISSLDSDQLSAIRKLFSSLDKS